MNTGRNPGLDLTNFLQLRPQIAKSALKNRRTSTLDRCVAPHRQPIHITRQEPAHVRLRDPNLCPLVPLTLLSIFSILLLPRGNALVRSKPLLPDFGGLLNRHGDANTSRIVA